MSAGTIRTGMGGWNFEPWRGVFYPKGLTQTKELEYATSKVRAIEVNGTFYSGQKRESYAKWAKAAPDGFVYSLKGNRFCVNRKILAEAGPSIERFFSQGMAELGPKLGPILWQFMHTKRYDAEDFAAFLKLLPRETEGIRLRHVVEPRHASFKDESFIALCREHDVAICVADHKTYPLIADVTSDFVYARLQTGEDENDYAYPSEGLDLWSGRLKAYAAGETPADLPRLAAPAAKTPRDVFAFIITGGKVHAPDGAVELQKRIDA
jgi:uncharacterized protein YecE (DUF72 family)